MVSLHFVHLFLKMFQSQLVDNNHMFCRISKLGSTLPFLIEKCGLQRHHLSKCLSSTDFSLRSWSWFISYLILGSSSVGPGIHDDRHVSLSSLPARAPSQNDLLQVEKRQPGNRTWRWLAPSGFSLRARRRKPSSRWSGIWRYRK